MTVQPAPTRTPQKPPEALQTLEHAARRLDEIERSLGMQEQTLDNLDADLQAWSQQLRTFMYANRQRAVAVAVDLLGWTEELLALPIDTRGWRYRIMDPREAWGAYTRAAAGVDVRSALVRMLGEQVSHQVQFGFTEGAWWSVQHAIFLARAILAEMRLYLEMLEPQDA